MTHPSKHHRWETEVFVLQAESRDGLVKECRELAEFLPGKENLELKDLAFTLNCPLHESAPFRLSIVSKSLGELGKKLDFAIKRLEDPQVKVIKDRSGIYFFDEPMARQGGVAFVFPGEGSQYPGMLGDLALHFPEVRACFDRADRVFIESDRTVLPSHVLFPHLLDDSSKELVVDSELFGMDMAVTVMFNASQAMNALLGNLDIVPQCIAGHSSGEFSALLASGAVPVDDDDQLVRYSCGLTEISANALKDNVPKASFLTVGGAGTEVVYALVEEFGGRLQIAMDNCPNQLIICGSGETIKEALASLQKKGAICSYLPFDRAYHTPEFTPVVEEFFRFFKTIETKKPDVTIFSCATCEPYPDEPDAIRRLAVDQWAMAVRFRETVEAMYAAGARIFVEVGPRDALIGFINDILTDRPYVAVPSNVPFRPATTQVNHLVGMLAAHGVDMRLDHLYEYREPHRLSFDDGAQAAKPKKRGPRMDLKLSLPHMGLEKNPFEGRTPVADREPVAEKVDGPEPGEPLPEEAPAARAVSPAPEPAEEIPAGAAQPIAAAIDQPAAASDAETTETEGRIAHSPRAVMMKDYLDTMERFLETQEAVMTAFRRRGRPEAGPRTKPFDFEMIAEIPGREVKVTLRLDVREHTFLMHHTLGRLLSNRDETLLGLPVVPLTMSAEILAQAAALLCPGKKVIGMRNLRTARWVEVTEEQPFDLFLTAKLKEGSGNEVDVGMAEAAGGPRQGGTNGSRPAGAPFVTGTIIFGDDYPAPPEVALPAIDPSRPYPLAPDEYYTKLMFHGPAFQGVRSIDKIDDGGIEATIDLPAERGLFRSHPNPDLLTELVLLDVAGQLVIFWTGGRFDEGFVGFPTGYDQLNVYSAIEPGSGPFKCYVATSAPDESQFSSNIYVVDGQGKLLLEYVAWKDLRFLDWSRKVVDAMQVPCRNMLSAPFPVTDVLPAAGGFAACACDESGAELWKRVVAYIILSRRERPIWLNLQGIEKRKREWLQGRLAAKDAVRLFVKRKYGVDLCPTEIEIVNNENNRPVAGGEALNELGLAVQVSIAHCSRGAVALAGDGSACQGVGIDVEALDRDISKVMRGAFHPEEQALLAGLEPGETQGWLVRFWCAKEALAKALGKGLMGSPLNVVIQGFDKTTGRVDMKIVGGLAQQFPPYVDKILSAHSGHDESVAFATSVV